MIYVQLSVVKEEKGCCNRCHTSEKCNWQVTTANLTTASNYLQFPIPIFNTDLRQVVQDYVLPYIGYCLPIISVIMVYDCLAERACNAVMHNSIALVTFCDTLNQSDLNDSQFPMLLKTRLDLLRLHSWKETSASEIQHRKGWDRPQNLEGQGCTDRRKRAHVAMKDATVAVVRRSYILRSNIFYFYFANSLIVLRYWISKTTWYLHRT